MSSMNTLEILHVGFELVVYPGLLFSVVAGLLFVWLMRKSIARLQSRIGPSIYQPFADVLKLLSKEDIAPARARLMFNLAPIISLSAAIAAMLLIPVGCTPAFDFVGNVVVLISLLAIPNIATMAESHNPLSARKEVGLTAAYEVGFVIAILTLCIDAGSLRIADLTRPYLMKYPFAAIVFLVCAHAKLGLTPFDIHEAKTEIIAGPYTEYSGRKLAMFKLTHAVLLLALSSLFVALFIPGPFTGIPPLDALIHLLKSALIVVLLSVIAASNPRVRIDQALKFFWTFVVILAAIDFVRAVVGVIV